MRQRFKRYEENEEPVVNLTPLIDIVFTILIMFIVIAPLLELDRVELADGNGRNEEILSVKEASPIAIHVQRNNTVWMDQKQVTLVDLPTVLQQKKREYPKARPQLYQDKQAHFGTYQSVKNAAESSGFDEMDIILMPAC